ncbi:MAG: tyrosine-type recombinase/integrase [Patescibacteria group bacterium]|jgi:site-specific recombinase XerD
MADLERYRKEFLEYLEIERNRSAATIRNYSFYLDRFVAWAEERGSKNAKDLSAELIRQYRLWLNRLTDARGESLKKNTQNYHLIALRSFLKYLAKRDVTSLAPEKIELMKMPDRSIEFLSSTELERLLNAPTLVKQPKILMLRDQAMLASTFSTGLRVSELANLKIDQVNLRDTKAHTLTEFSVRGKGSKVRVVFLSSDARALLRSYIEARHDASPYLFIRHDRAKTKQTERERKEGGAPLTPRSIERIVSRYAKVAGITKKVSPHTLRHSFATDLLINGADLRSVQSLLGHASVTTTQIYTHLTDQQLRHVHEQFHGKTR